VITSTVFYLSVLSLTYLLKNGIMSQPGTCLYTAAAERHRALNQMLILPRSKYTAARCSMQWWQCDTCSKNYLGPSTDWLHTFNGPLSRTTRVSRYQKGETNLDFTEARDCEWQWHQLGNMQVCTSLQTDNHTSTPPLSFFYRPDALPAAQPTVSKH